MPGSNKYAARLCRRFSQMFSKPLRVMGGTLVQAIYSLFRTGSYTIGAFFLQFIRLAGQGFHSLYARHLQPHSRRVGTSLRILARRLGRMGRYPAGRLRSFFRFFPDAFCVIRNGYREGRLPGALRAAAAGVRNNSHLFVTIINYTMPVAAVLMLVHVVQYVQNFNFAISVEYNGQQIGYIENETVFEEANVRVQERLTYLPEDEWVDSVPLYTIAVASPDDVKSAAEITNAIIETSSEEMVQATGLYIDGTLIGAVENFSGIRAALDGLLDSYRTGLEGEVVSFVKHVEWESGLYLASHLTDSQSIIDLVTSETQGDVYYTVQSGDAPSTIASAYDMSLDELVSMNPTILDTLLIGQNVLVKKSKPYLEVQITRPETYTQAIPYETTYTASANLWEGTQQLVSSGVEGQKSVTANVSYVNGEEVSREILSETVLLEPVNEVVAKGTREMLRDPNAYIGATDTQSGMMNPVSQQSPYISQVYGHTRYESHHNAIDIAFRGNGYGVPIYSVLPGTVIFSGWQGSYGNLVIVDHGNGFQTWYAHCSKLYVRSGDTVAQGETIAAVGSTGNSSGNHLHFRVIYNYTEQDPEDYIPGYTHDAQAR